MSFLLTDMCKLVSLKIKNKTFHYFPMAVWSTGVSVFHKNPFSKKTKSFLLNTGLQIYLKKNSQVKHIQYISSCIITSVQSFGDHYEGFELRLFYLQEYSEVLF